MATPQSGLCLENRVKKAYWGGNQWSLNWEFMAGNSYILPTQGATCSSSRLTVTTTRWKTLGLLLLRLQCRLHLCHEKPHTNMLGNFLVETPSPIFPEVWGFHDHSACYIVVAISTQIQIQTSALCKLSCHGFLKWENSKNMLLRLQCMLHVRLWSPIQRDRWWIS